MSFWEHLTELRTRLLRSILFFVVACLIAWEYRDQVFLFFWAPCRDAWLAAGLPNEPHLNFASPSDIFTAHTQVTFLASAAATAPFAFYQLWAFVAPGLYSREKRMALPFIAAGSQLFILGGYFAWKAVLPMILGFLFGLSQSTSAVGIPIEPTLMMSSYLDFCLQQLLIFGVVFEIPLVVLLLAWAGLVNWLQLFRFGRWFILIAFVVAAVLTPPDVTSQVMMAVPMCVLYAISIGLAYIFGKKPSEREWEEFRRK